VTTEPVDWSALRACYGPATAVPGWLDDLFSDDAGEREHAIGELYSNLCHQETVYEASAVAVPRLFDAVRRAPLTRLQRQLVLSLLVYIGRGEDTCWEGHTPWEVVVDCRRAVAELAPELFRWSVDQPADMRAWALALVPYFPEELAAAGVSPAELGRSMTEPSLIAVRSLVEAIVAGTTPGEDQLRAAASTDEDTLDYLEDGLDDEPPDRRARLVVLELASKGAQATLAS
jgi:hypothetical protein